MFDGALFEDTESIHRVHAVVPFLVPTALGQLITSIEGNILVKLFLYFRAIVRTYRLDLRTRLLGHLFFVQTGCSLYFALLQVLIVIIDSLLQVPFAPFDELDYFLLLDGVVVGEGSENGYFFIHLYIYNILITTVWREP